MPNEIDRTSSAQRRSSKLLTAMAIFICLGIAAYMVLTLLVNRQTPATPDTHYTGTNGISVYYDSSVWSVCRMTEDATLGTVLELATADTADSEVFHMRRYVWRERELEQELLPRFGAMTVTLPSLASLFAISIIPGDSKPSSFVMNICIVHLSLLKKASKAVLCFVSILTKTWKRFYTISVKS